MEDNFDGIEVDEMYILLPVPEDTYELSISAEARIDNQWQSLFATYPFKETKEAREDFLNINKYRPEHVDDFFATNKECDEMYISVSIPTDSRKIKVECKVLDQDGLQTKTFSLKQISLFRDLYLKYDPDDDFYALYRLTDAGRELLERMNQIE